MEGTVHFDPRATLKVRLTDHSPTRYSSVFTTVVRPHSNLIGNSFIRIKSDHRRQLLNNASPGDNEPQLL